MSPDLIHQIVRRNHGGERGLIGSLLEIQTKYGYLPEEALRLVSDATSRSLVEVYGVATFYRAFSLKRRGKHLVSCCLGTACHVRGAPEIARELEKRLMISPGNTTADEEFTFETVNCLGACALGPIVVIDGQYFSQVNSSMITGLLAGAREGVGKIEIRADQKNFQIPVRCPSCNHDLIDPTFALDGLPSIKITLTHGEKQGWLRLSSLYGSYTSASEHNVPEGEVIEMFCPYCSSGLRGPDYCPECGEGMASMLVTGGGTIQICPRHGCKGHLLDL